MKLSNDRRAHEGATPTWLPIPAWRWMLAALVAVVITAFVVTIWLLTIASHAKPGTDQANARLDAVRTGLAAGAGAGAAVGLMLAFRRQHHQEIATVLTDRDATERRITELYTKAVEQLGNDKAPVRLGGLYALERLAQDNPAHRQTIVNVICAYLRMPFSATAPTRKPEPEAAEDPRERGTQPETTTDGNGDTWPQERQVRLTAQRILAEHLGDGSSPNQRSAGPPDPRFWPDIRLDLAGATLIDFNLITGVVAGADFKGATFSGDAMFVVATFGHSARFRGATFSGVAGFVEATFGHSAGFQGATFGSRAVFRSAAFKGDADFGGATFSRGDADFGTATFSGRARFGGAAFAGRALFDTIFSGEANFEGATFGEGESSPFFEGSRVLSSGARDVWPTGWCLEPDGSGGYTVVRATG